MRQIRGTRSNSLGVAVGHGGTHCHGGRSAMEASPKERERERERDVGLKQMKVELTANVAESCGLAVIFIFES